MPTHLLNFSCKSYCQLVYSYLAKVFRFVYYRKIHLPFKDLKIGIFNQPSEITSPPFPSTPIPPFTRILKFHLTYLWRGSHHMGYDYQKVTSYRVPRNHKLNKTWSINTCKLTDVRLQNSGFNIRYIIHHHNKLPWN